MAYFKGEVPLVYKIKAFGSTDWHDDRNYKIVPVCTPLLECDIF